MSLNRQVIARTLEARSGAAHALVMYLMAWLASKNMNRVIHHHQRDHQDTRQVATDLL